MQLRREWRIVILSKLLILLVSLSFSQFAAADIATDIADGVKTRLATQTAKDDNVTAEDAVVELIKAGVNPVDAVVTVRDVYGLTPLETDNIITAVINALPPGANTTPLVALYSTGGGLRLAIGPVGTQGIGDVGGSGEGTPTSPN